MISCINVHPFCRKQSKKDNENKGRHFYSCPTSQCRFFRWGCDILRFKNSRYCQQAAKPSPQKDRVAEGNGTSAKKKKA